MNGKLITLIIILAVAMLFTSDVTQSNQNVTKVDNFVVMAREAEVAALIARMKRDNLLNSELQKYKCTNCNDTGFIRSGDGLNTVKCPECNATQTTTRCNCGCGRENCNCKASGCLVKEEVSLKKQMIKFGAKWCPPCVLWDSVEAPKLVKSEWVVDDSDKAMVRLVDIDKNRELYNKYGKNRALPVFVMLVDGTEVEANVGYLSANQVATIYNRY
jgi:thiol-disulfide isomerase/thioredoxin